MARTRVLVVEDDEAVRALFLAVFAEQGWDVKAVGDGLQAVEVARGFRPHLAVIDNTLPGLDGKTICKRLKAEGDAMVLFVTGAVTMEDKRAGYAAGGDDYLCKPFAPEEALLRAKALIRRSGAEGPAQLQVGDLAVDTSRHRVTRAGHDIRLTDIEFRILVALLRQPGRLVSAEQLRAAIWGVDDQGTARALEVRMSQLRHKLEQHGERIIRTERGIGYILDP